MRLLSIAAVFVSGVFAAQSAHADLRVGDLAPEFTMNEWLKGAPETLAAGKGKTIYVLDFWATWCMPCIQGIPHLNELQERYRDKGVVIVGVTGPVRGQQLSQVKQFMAQRGSAISFSIAWDQSNKMWSNYLDGVGANGIPYMMIIDKNSRIAWHGYPSPNMDRVLDELVAGTFDVAKEAKRAENETKIDKLLPKYRPLASSGNWEGAIGVLDEALVIDPTRADILTEAYLLHRRKVGDETKLRNWVTKFLETHGKDADALLAMATMLQSLEAYADRLPDMMLRAAQEGYKASGGNQAAAMRVLAIATYRVGNLDEAIRLQIKAHELANDSQKPGFENLLNYLNKCKSLRDKKVAQSQ